MNLVKQTGYRTTSPLQMTTALQILGVPREFVCQSKNNNYIKSTNQAKRDKKRRMGGSLMNFTFWRRSEWEIADVLKLASQCHRTRIKRLHTDKGGNSDEAIAHLKAWSFVKRHAVRRGYGEYL